MRSPHTRNEESALLTTVRDSLCAAVSPVQPEINKKIIKKKKQNYKDTFRNITCIRHWIIFKKTPQFILCCWTTVVTTCLQGTQNTFWMTTVHKSLIGTLVFLYK